MSTPRISLPAFDFLLAPVFAIVVFAGAHPLRQLELLAQAAEEILQTGQPVEAAGHPQQPGEGVVEPGESFLLVVGTVLCS